MTYRCTKHYGHNEGLTATFRQWRAASHCRYIHGYALAFTFEFECQTLDDRNWVVDFGSLKPLKAWLKDMFDHRLLVARDDPCLATLLDIEVNDLGHVIMVDNTGCEAFAKLAWEKADSLLVEMGLEHRVVVRKVTVAEHGGNSASYLIGDS